MTITEPINVKQSSKGKSLVQFDIPKRDKIDDTVRSAIQITGDTKETIKIEDWITPNSWVTDLQDLKDRKDNGTPLTLDIYGKQSEWYITSLSWIDEGGINKRKITIELEFHQYI